LLLPEVRSGTVLKITFEDKRELAVEYVKNTDYQNFSIRSNDIARNIEEFREKAIEVGFSSKLSDYCFTAKVLGLASKFGSTDTVDCVVTSLFKETPHRVEARIDVSMKVKIYSYLDLLEKKFRGDLLCECVSDNLSRGGIRIFSDFDLSELPDSKFTLEFALIPSSTFIAPARLVRGKKNTASRAYNYDYGFVFDFEHIPEYREKLMLDLLQFKIKAGR